MALFQALRAATGSGAATLGVGMRSASSCRFEYGLGAGKRRRAGVCKQQWGARQGLQQPQHSKATQGLSRCPWTPCMQAHAWTQRRGRMHAGAMVTGVAAGTHRGASGLRGHVEGRLPAAHGAAGGDLPLGQRRVGRDGWGRRGSVFSVRGRFW